MAHSVFIYEDNNARRDSLRALLDISPSTKFAGDAPDCRNVLDDMTQFQPEVVLMDINMPHANGIEGLKKIRTHFPHIKVLIQTVLEDDDTIFECIKNGADGYLLKKDPPQKIIDSINDVQEGGSAMNPGVAKKVLQFFNPVVHDYGLSQREQEVLTLLSDGLSYKMVADRLNVSFNTVNSHVKRIYEKLHISSLGEAIAFYYKHLR
jgi:DNA-binding NarL/FixJ family response regulator